MFMCLSEPRNQVVPIPSYQCNRIAGGQTRLAPGNSHSNPHKKVDGTARYRLPICRRVLETVEKVPFSTVSYGPEEIGGRNLPEDFRPGCSPFLIGKDVPPDFPYRLRKIRFFAHLLTDIPIGPERYRVFSATNPPTDLRERHSRHFPQKVHAYFSRQCDPCMAITPQDFCSENAVEDARMLQN